MAMPRVSASMSKKEASLYGRNDWINSIKIPMATKEKNFSRLKDCFGKEKSAKKANAPNASKCWTLSLVFCNNEGPTSVVAR